MVQNLWEVVVEWKALLGKRSRCGSIVVFVLLLTVG